MKDNYFLEGPRIGLRRLEEADITNEYLDWVNDKEVTKFTDIGFLPESKSELFDYYQTIRSSKSNLFMGIIWKETDQHIGNVKLGPINWVHRHSAYSILIGNKEFWGQGICEEVTRIVCDHVFLSLNLNRIHLGVVDKNMAAITAYGKVGFIVEGESRKYFWVDGEYHNNVNMALLREEYLSEGAEKVTPSSNIAT